jgi:hypothetical protein
MRELGDKRRSIERWWLLEVMVIPTSEDPGARYTALMEWLGIEDEMPNRNVEDVSDIGFQALGGMEKVVE